MERDESSIMPPPGIHAAEDGALIPRLAKSAALIATALANGGDGITMTHRQGSSDPTVLITLDGDASDVEASIPTGFRFDAADPSHAAMLAERLAIIARDAVDRTIAAIRAGADGHQRMRAVCDAVAAAYGMTEGGAFVSRPGDYTTGGVVFESPENGPNIRLESTAALDAVVAECAPARSLITRTLEGNRETIHVGPFGHCISFSLRSVDDVKLLRFACANHLDPIALARPILERPTAR